MIPALYSWSELFRLTAGFQLLSQPFASNNVSTAPPGRSVHEYLQQMEHETIAAAIQVIGRISVAKCTSRDGCIYDSFLHFNNSMGLLHFGGLVLSLILFHS